MPEKLEVELKFAIPDASTMRAKLADLDAKSHGRHHEVNVRLDNDVSTLTNRDITLRVRTTQHPESDNTERLVTVKTPAHNPNGIVRARREIEFAVSDDQAVIAALNVLGYQPRWIYEKYREYFSLDGVEVSLDETPIGVFVELEGSQQNIMRAALKLGLKMPFGLTESYAILFNYARNRLKFDAHDMTFEAVGDIEVDSEMYELLRQPERLIALLDEEEG